MAKSPDYKTILYATDLGKHTRPVFRHAVNLAGKCGAQIVMLHAVKPLGATSRAVIGAYLPDLDLGELEHDGMDEVVAKMQQRLEKFCKEEGEACDADSSMVSDIVVRAGMPSEVVLQTAIDYKADLVVMGSCTHSLFGHHSFGSTVRKVTHHSTIPVLVVPNAQI